MSIEEVNSIDLQLETLLRCPVCFELPPPPIFLCVRGHPVCEKCKALLEDCPTCKGNLTRTRSFLAEDLIQKIEFLPHKQNASEEGGTYKKRKIEKNPCRVKSSPLPSGNYKCILEGCKNSGQPEAISVLFKHVKKVHQHLYDHHANTSGTFKTTIKYKYKRQKNYQRAIHVSNMGLFILEISITGDHYINGSLKLSAPEFVANKFDFELVIYRDKQNFSFVDKVAPIKYDNKWLLQRGRVMVIQAEDHSLFPEFSVDVTIVLRLPGKKINAATCI